ncbi:MAG TPA: protealysin inhibitor emfourin [Candidatus Acidoferrum sp.]|nr:protealysin inhibitor emfourin [Candidatus Acidoferrum sp.]
MRIRVRQLGGFAGEPLELGRVDTATLPADVAAALHQTVDQAHFFDLPAVVPSDSVGADLLVYEITVEDGDRRHSVSFVEDGSEAASPLRGLKTQLVRAAR